MRAYDVKESRSLLKQYALAVGLTLGIALLVVISAVIVLFGDTIVEALSHGGAIADVWKIAQWPLVLALILFAFAVTYYSAPDLPNRQWHWITPGAILGLVLWMAVSVALRIYLHFFGSYSATYGSLGAVIVMLLWFDLSGVAVLSGAALNGVLQKLAATASVPRKSEPSPSADDAAIGVEPGSLLYPEAIQIQWEVSNWHAEESKIEPRIAGGLGNEALFLCRGTRFGWFRASSGAGAQGLDAANRSQHQRRGPGRSGRH